MLHEETPKTPPLRVTLIDTENILKLYNSGDIIRRGTLLRKTNVPVCEQRTYYLVYRQPKTKTLNASDSSPPGI